MRGVLSGWGWGVRKRKWDTADSRPDGIDKRRAGRPHPQPTRGVIGYVLFYSVWEKDGKGVIFASAPTKLRSSRSVSVQRRRNVSETVIFIFVRSLAYQLNNCDTFVIKEESAIKQNLQSSNGVLNTAPLTSVINFYSVLVDIKRTNHTHFIVIG